MNNDQVLYEKRGHIAIMTLHRPERMNSVSISMQQRINEIWEEYRADRSLRVAIVTGAGDRAFCGGMDVKEAAGASVGELWNSPDSESRMGNGRALWKPVICAVNGVCAGIGLGLVVDSDIAICSDNATFVDPHVTIGQVAATQAIALTRRIPLQVVLRMALRGTSERLTAQQALTYGLVTEVTTQERLMPTAIALAESIAANSPAAVMASKRSIMEGLDLPYTEAMVHGLRILQDHWKHPDHLEGPKAFAEKRKPKWQG